MTTPPARRTGSHHYQVFGLTIMSELLLPDLIPSDPVERPDVSIKCGAIPPQPGETAHTLTATPEGAILNVPSAGRYLIRDGSELLVEPDPAGSDRNTRLFLLGSAFGVVLHQRHILPLHANAIVLGDRAVAFLGISGSGKSTMAAWLHDRGHPILTDDVCAVTIEGGLPLVQPGIPRLRLWRDALEATGRTSEGYERSFDEDDKYNVPTRSMARAPVQLAAIYQLDGRDPERKTQSIDRLSGLDAADALIANTYRGEYLTKLGGVAEHFKSCVDLAARVPIFLVRRRWGRDVYDEQLASLEAHASDAVNAR